jgi:hypothetical protein
MTTYRFHRVELEAPEHWIDMSTIVLLSPDGPPDHRPNVVLARDLAPGIEVDAYAKEQSTRMRKELRAYKLHAEEAADVGGRAGRFFDHSFKTPENVSVRQHQIYVRDGDFIVILSMSHVESDFERMRGDFERVRKSFRLA